MPLGGWEFVNGPFHDVEYLIEQNNILFDTQIIPRGGPTPFAAAAERMIPHRHWEQAAVMIEPRFERVLKELGIFYVPKQLAPGPCFCFVHTDSGGKRARAKISPFGWQLVVSNAVAKYGLLGLKHEFRGPTWLGNSEETIERILKHKFVVLVEGPFDLVACRLVADIPVLSTGTKSLNEMHFAYLKVLGVESLCLLFDQELGKGSARGAGSMAMKFVSLEAARQQIQPIALACPAKDPSACLETLRAASMLKELLEHLF